MTGLLRGQLADYLALRRALGYRLARPEKLLGQFLDHLDRAGESRITVATALDWARLPAGGDSNWWAYRLAFTSDAVTHSVKRYGEHMRRRREASAMRMGATGLLAPAVAGPLVRRHEFHGQHTDPRS